jgi:RNA polymerase sigma-B factor
MIGACSPLRGWEGSAPRSGMPDAAEREQLITEHLSLAEQIARRFANRGEPHDDLVQVASLALVKAADAFDPGQGFDFAAFASRTMIGELKHHFRDKGWAIRAPRRVQELYLEMNAAVAELTQELGRSPTIREIATACDRSEGDVLAAIEAGQGYRATSLDAHGPPGRSLLERLEGSREAVGLPGQFAELSPHLDRLAPREQLIVRLRFVDELTQSEIADRLGMSQMHVSRLLRAALETLRDAYRAPTGER